MVKAMDLDKFKDFVKENGCYIVFDTKHMNYIYDSKDNLVSTFAITHQKGSKDFVKPTYIKIFFKAIDKKGDKSNGHT